MQGTNCGHLRRPRRKPEVGKPHAIWPEITDWSRQLEHVLRETLAAGTVMSDLRGQKGDIPAKLRKLVRELASTGRALERAFPGAELERAIECFCFRHKLPKPTLVQLSPGTKLPLKNAKPGTILARTNIQVVHKTKGRRMRVRSGKSKVVWVTDGTLATHKHVGSVIPHLVGATFVVICWRESGRLHWPKSIWISPRASSREVLEVLRQIG